MQKIVGFWAMIVVTGFLIGYGVYLGTRLFFYICDQLKKRNK